MLKFLNNVYLTTLAMFRVMLSKIWGEKAMRIPSISVSSTIEQYCPECNSKMDPFSTMILSSSMLYTPRPFVISEMI